jgi:hypothetical protein
MWQSDPIANDQGQRVTTTSAAKPSAELGDTVLLRLAAIAAQFGAEYTSGDARSAAERVAEGLFNPSSALDKPRLEAGLAGSIRNGLKRVKGFRSMVPRR